MVRDRAIPNGFAGTIQVCQKYDPFEEFREGQFGNWPVGG